MTFPIVILFFVRPFLKRGNHATDNRFRQALTSAVNQSIPNAIIILLINSKNDVGNFLLVRTMGGIVHKQLFSTIPEHIPNIPAGVIAHFKYGTVGLVKCRNQFHAGNGIVHTGF